MTETMTAAWRSTRPIYRGFVMVSAIFGAGLGSGAWVIAHASQPATNAVDIIAIKAVDVRQDADIVRNAALTDTTRIAVRELRTLLVQDICLRKAQKFNTSYEDCLQAGAQ